MSPDMQEKTIDMMLKNKEKVSIKEALEALKSANKALGQNTSALSLKYKIRLHIRQNAA